MITAPNIPDGDAFFARLAALHEGRSAEESLALDSRLILLLANQIGDREVLEAILAAAQAGLASPRAAG